MIKWLVIGTFQISVNVAKANTMTEMEKRITSVIDMDEYSKEYAEGIRRCKTYDEMTESDMVIVVDYEVNYWKDVIKNLSSSTTKEQKEKIIHGAWNKWEMADDTEDELSKWLDETYTA